MLATIGEHEALKRDMTAAAILIPAQGIPKSTARVYPMESRDNTLQRPPSGGFAVRKHCSWPLLHPSVLRRLALAIHACPTCCSFVWPLNILSSVALFTLPAQLVTQSSSFSLPSTYRFIHQFVIDCTLTQLLSRGHMSVIWRVRASAVNW